MARYTPGRAVHDNLRDIGFGRRGGYRGEDIGQYVNPNPGQPLNEYEKKTHDIERARRKRGIIKGYSGDRRLDKIQYALAMDAYNFKKNLGDYRGQLYDQVEDQYKTSLDQGNKDIRTGMSRRGLLYSGLRAGKESELKSGLESQLASAKYDINRESSELLRQKKHVAETITLQTMANMQANLENLYNTQMQNQLMRRQAMGSLASGIGYAAGAYYGNQQNPYGQTGNQGMVQPSAQNQYQNVLGGNDYAARLGGRGY